MPIEYKMSKEMYDSIRNSQIGRGRNKKPLTEKEMLAYVNTTFGLRQKVTNIILI